VRKFVDLVSRCSGGAAAALKDEDAVVCIRTLYDLEVVNGFNYQTPPGILESVLVQEIKYPRDVLAGKAGTCIDLAILYASCCEATSLKSFLVMIPGHCFPLFILPSGRPLPVEATAIGRLPFEDACKQAQETLQKAQQDGRIILADIEEIWKQGVSPPELPALPEDCLEKWGIGMPRGTVATTPFPTVQPSTPGPQPAGLAGTWTGTAFNTTVGVGARIDLQLQQSETQIVGQITVYPPLQGSGQVQGTIFGNTLYLEATTPFGSYTLEATVQGNHIEGSYVIASFYGTQQGVISVDKMP
jgi:hypothetical protein